jgi:hypothetical protein
MKERLQKSRLALRSIATFMPVLSEFPKVIFDPVTDILQALRRRK